jgi:hypothetical protein
MTTVAVDGELGRSAGVVAVADRGKPDWLCGGKDNLNCGQWGDL